MLDNPQRASAIKEYNAIIDRLAGVYGKDSDGFLNNVTKYCRRLEALRVPRIIRVMLPMLANYVVASSLKWNGSDEWIIAEHEAKEMEYEVFCVMHDSEHEFQALVMCTLQICDRTGGDLCASILSTAYAKLMLRATELKFLEGK